MNTAAPPSPNDAIGAAVAQGLAAWLRACATPMTRPPHLAVGLSGGADSMLLLAVAADLASGLGVTLSAVHVHHGISAHADAWAGFCAAECTARGVPLELLRVAVPRRAGASREADARAARYAAFAGLDVDALALAHHADDQAETLLLQLLRGAGPAGLAAMPAQRAPASGPTLLRPLLGLPRALLRAAATARGLAWIEDDSNADLGIRRNYLRAEVAPRLATAFPGYPRTLLRAAAHQADATRLADDLAALDATDGIESDPVDGPTLTRDSLGRATALGGHRARNLLRWFLRQHALAAPSMARLDAMLKQLTGAAADARVRIAHDGVEIGLHRRRVVVHAPAAPWDARPWQGEAVLVLPHGRLVFAPARGEGLAVDPDGPAPLLVRRRAGGERLRPGPGRSRQLLTHLFQQQGIPTWQRDAWPLLYCGEDLVAVPGIGADPAASPGDGLPGVVVAWLPQPRQTLTPVNATAPGTA